MKAQAAIRSAGLCEACGLRYKRPEFDHVLTVWDGGQGTLENCQVLCEACHKAKTADDVRSIRKTERIRDRHLGALVPKGRPIAGSRRSGLKRKMNGTVERRK